MLKKFIKIFCFFLGFLFLGIVSLAILFQTEFAQNKIKDFVSSQTMLSYEKLEGTLPYVFTLKDVKITLDDRTIAIKTLKARPSLFAFFRKQIHLHELTATDVIVTSKKSNVEIPNASSLSDLPYSLKISRYQINNMVIDGQSYSIKGKFKISENLKSYAFTSNVIKKGFSNSFVNFRLRKKRQFKPIFQLDVVSENEDFLSPLIEIPQSFEGRLSLNGKGEKNLLNDLIQGNIPTIQALAEGEVLEKDISYAFSFNLTTPFLHFDNVYVTSDLFSLKTHFSVKKDFSIETSPYILDLNILDSQFKTEGTFSYKDFLKANFTAKTSSFTLDEFTFENFEAEGSLTYQDKLKAIVNSSVDALENRYYLKANVSTDEGNYQFSSLELRSPYLTANGNLTLLKNDEILGKISGDFTYLSFIKKYLPAISDVGRGKFVALFKNKQNVQVDVAINNFYYHNFQVKRLTTNFNSLDYSFENLENIQLKIENANYQHLNIQSVTVETSTTEENWPFSINIQGNLTEPIDINSTGFWRYVDNNLSVNIQQLTGSLLNHPFITKEPIDLEWTKEQLALTEFQIDLIDASITAKANMTEANGSLQTSIKNFPVDFLLLFSPYYDLTGTFSMDANLDNQNSQLTGNITADFKDLSLPSIEENLKVDGKLVAGYKDSSLDIKTNFTIDGKPYLLADGKIPIEIDPVLLSYEIEKEAPLNGKISFSGNISDILDLFDLGPHTFSGNLNGDFSVHGTLAYPEIEGKGYLTQGFYENAYTGTRLQEISATVKADRTILTLESLSSKGPNGGFLNALGSVDLDHGDFPFLFDIEFNELRAVEVGYFDALGRGKLTLEGNKEKALLSGDVWVKDANFTIAEKLPTSIPDLPITYLHAPPAFDAQKSPVSSPTTYPFNLDVKIDSPDNVFITGRGVESEWKGDFQIKGNINAPITAGTIELLKGSFRFSGKEFTLTEGRLTFPEKSEAEPMLFLTGKINEKNTTIIVNLNGPLTSPKLTFASIPSLSTSSILSLLLFGQDISEISAPQAIQLAALVSSLSGDGPDILESTRKSLGIDRLTLVTVPEKEDLEALSIQVGKYVSKGVLVTVSQGFGADQTSVGVEVDLGRGFVFQAESQQFLEQGRFTLKWNVTY